MDQQPTTFRTALKWGVIMGLVLIVYTLFLYLTDNVGNTWLGLVSFAISIVGLVFAMRDFRTLNGGYMSYGEGITIGTLTATISGLLSSLFSLFYTKVIDTGLMERVAEQTREKLEEAGIDDDQIDAQMEMMERFQSAGFTFAFGMMGAVIGGLILSLIIAAFMRKNKSNPFD